MRLKLLILLFVPLIVCGQFISVKSLPVSTGDQFLLYPSKNLAMGGVHIAVDDPWLENFKNPAKGNYMEGLQFFLQPTFYSISDNLGGARSIPGSFVLVKGNWFASVSATFQQLEGANISSNPDWFSPQPFGPDNRYSDNRYLYLSLGKKLPNEKLMLGGSVFWADLNAVGGVDLLYSTSSHIDQDGSIYEFRGGLVYEDDYSMIEALLLYNNYEMLHEVTFLNWVWDENLQSSLQQIQMDRNFDRTDTYGLHVKYKERFSEEGPSIGASFTYNWKTHPKIPNYEIMNIPRDPGNTWAYNFGIGIGNETEKSRFGIDFVYEPIWSNTWGTAEDDIDAGNGRIINAGEKTIENNFTFNNWVARIGMNRFYGAFDLSAGLEIYNRKYNLDQYNYINDGNRSQQEDWAEYRWSWGVGLHFKRFYLRYNGHMMTGAGIPSVNQWVFFDEMRAVSADIVAAPSGRLNIDYKTTYTHQFVVQIPLDIKL